MNGNNLKRIDRYINELEVIKYFLENDYYTYQVAQHFNISPSCVKKYLNDPNIGILLGEDVVLEIRKKLDNNEHKGQIRGSENYVLFNEAIKLPTGEFCGSIPRI